MSLVGANLRGAFAAPMSLSLIIGAAAADLSLSGAGWRCASSNGSVSVAATVPGLAHSALMDAGVLVGSPFYRDNEVAWSWVALEAWNFSRTFAVDDAELLASPSTIELDGVDGAATVRVNGEVVGAPHSAFVTWRFALRAGLLRAGANNVSVDFEPPREYALRQNASYANGSYEVPSSIYYHTWSEPSARNFLRKPPFSFGWDWGPSFMPSGITGGVRITSAAAPRLDELAVRQTHEPSGAVVVSVRGLLAPRERRRRRRRARRRAL